MGLPIIYSCSGCSSAAQAANWVALRLDRRGAAEMSCIAGVGAEVEPLLSKARLAEKIVVIDGCPLACARACLARAGRLPDVHLELSRLGVAKRFHDDFTPAEGRCALQAVVSRMHEAGLWAEGLADQELEAGTRRRTP